MFCPESSVTTDDDGNSFVWVIDAEKRAKSVAVKTGDTRDERTEITEGLDGNERVVIFPEELSDGTPVQVSE
jgi:multidrug efflux pump subunit AcrA (membrane-fusion protein)